MPEMPGQGFGRKKNRFPLTFYSLADNLLGSIRLGRIYQASTQRNPSPESIATSVVIPCPESDFR